MLEVWSTPCWKSGRRHQHRLPANRLNISIIHHAQSNFSYTGTTGRAGGLAGGRSGVRACGRTNERASGPRMERARAVLRRQLRVAVGYLDDVRAIASFVARRPSPTRPSARRPPIRRFARSPAAHRKSVRCLPLQHVTFCLPVRRTAPRLASPRLASPWIAWPHLTSPRLASPRLASPRLASPDRKSTRLNSSHRL